MIYVHLYCVYYRVLPQGFSYVIKTTVNSESWVWNDLSVESFARSLCITVCHTTHTQEELIAAHANDKMFNLLHI